MIYRGSDPLRRLTRRKAVATGVQRSRTGAATAGARLEVWYGMWERLTKGARALGVTVLVVAAGAAFAMACDDDDGDDGGSAGGGPVATATMPTAPAPTATPETDAGEVVLGETPGWAAGSTGTVFYTKDFFCNTEPCIVGEDGSNPAGVSDPVPTVWVLVPLFDDTEGIEFHCPVAGECPAHPSELDVSRIGLGDVIPLPPHSHIIDPGEAGFSAAGDTPWDVVVVGVMTRAAWDELETGKSLDALRQVQAQGEAAATGDVPSNVILFFGVR